MTTEPEDRFITITVLDVSRRPNSANGNPAWRLHTAHGWFDTTIDNMQSYEVAGTEHQMKGQPLKIWIDGDSDKVWKWERVPVTEPQIDEQQARAIAARWQSPGRVGSHLAAFASGAPVARENILWDIKATHQIELAMSTEDRHELRQLTEYIEALSSPLAP